MPTAWSPVTPPGPTNYTSVGKGKATWNPDPAKTPTALARTGKEQTDWTPFSALQVPYLYVSATVPYNSSSLGYVYANPVQNQENTKRPAEWTPSEV